MLSTTLVKVRRLLGGAPRETVRGNSFSGSRFGFRSAGGDLIFRLRSWPQLEQGARTAEIYRMLSVMSSQPVNRNWLMSRTRMAPEQLDRLLVKLVADGALEVIDPARFAGREPCQA
jgi:hypothetical protein